MPALLAALVLLTVVGFGTAWFLRANPTTLALRLRPILMVAGAIGVGGLLILVVIFAPVYLPEIFGIAGFVIAALIARAARKRPTPGFSTPGSGSSQRTGVNTAFLQAWIDHESNEVGALVIKGRHAGRWLENLSDEELFELHGDYVVDPDSLKVLESFLDRRMGPDW